MLESVNVPFQLIESIISEDLHDISWLNLIFLHSLSEPLEKSLLEVPLIEDAYNDK